MQVTQRNIVLPAIAVMLCFILAGCEDKQAQGPASPEVRFMAVTGEKLTLTRELPGRVVAFEVSEVRPQVGGIIKERLFDEGSDVQAGQVLYQIDPALYEAAYNNAKAELARTQANLVSARLLAQRYAKIVATNAISKQDYDDAVAAHNQAKAAVEAARQAVATAEINLGYTKVTAPVSGRIGRSSVTPGALVTQNQATPLATIQQLDKVYVDVTQSNSELLKLRRALTAGRLRSSGPESAKVRLLLEDGTAYASNVVGMEKGEEPNWQEGALLFSEVTIDQSTGAVTLRATFDNPDSMLLPGMYVRAVLEEGVRENAVLVPQKTVMRDTRGMPYVFVLSKNAPENAESAKSLNGGEYYIARRGIEIDRDYNNNWLVTSGLQVGDLVLVDGMQKVRPGGIVLGTRLETNAFAKSDSAEKATAATAERQG
ncbi:MAG: Multidrug resistance protein MexA [Desulfovibrio sp.]